MLWISIRIAIGIDTHNIRFYEEILKIITSYHSDTNPRFPPFSLYVLLDVNLGSLLYEP